MASRRNLFMLLCLPLLACAGNADTARVRAGIESEIARSLEATRTQNIDLYMESIPPDLVIYDESGAVITREQLRAATLRDWSIIPRTLEIGTTVDSLRVRGDSATVFTSQRWRRLMLQRDGITIDTVLTSQRHREEWRRSGHRWYAYEIEELGGQVFINGERYDPHSQ